MTITHSFPRPPRTPHPRPIVPRIVLALLAAVFVQYAASAQSTAMPGDTTIDAAMRESTVGRIGDLLKERYVFPDVAVKCAEHLQSQLKSGAYDKFSTAFPFADTLTRDLQSISHDKHLRVNVRAPQSVSMAEAVEPTPEQQREMRARMTAEMRKDNFGFQKLERLDGNIGYLDLHGFVPAEIGGDTAVAAMRFLANSDAIIIDLRHNGGGSPDMIQLISTYFFEEPTLLNTMYWREGDRTDQFWTLPHVPGKRMADTPLFILTSQGTFSGAEEFAYNMKNLKRATIIGETTGGGAHPGGGMPVNDLFGMFVPVGRAINPISKTNWEGVGVEPDISVPADQALTLAHIKAIEALEKTADAPEDKARLTWAKSALESAANPPAALPEKELQRYAGSYGERRVWVKDGRLTYQRGEMPARTLTLMSKDLFAVDGVPYFRIRFEAGEGGKAARLIGLYDDGRAEPMERSGD